MAQNKKVIAVTGGIGAGKSTVCKYLSSKGFCTLDCDAISREVSADKAVLSEISATFGANFVSGGELQRKALREFVFNNKERVDALNNIFSNRITAKLKCEIEKTEGEILFVEVSNYSATLRQLFTAVWLVTASYDKRVNRVVFRDDVSACQVEKLIERQTAVVEPDEIIENDGFADELYRRIDKLLEKL